MSKYLFRAVVLIVVVISGEIYAQQQAVPDKSFDVISIKRVLPPPPAPAGEWAHGVNKEDCQFLPARMVCQLSLLELIKEAYQITSDAKIVAPDWMGDQEHVFELQATMPLGTTQADARSMLRGALVERFGLRVHSEVRKITEYALLPITTGPRLQAVKTEDDVKRKSVDTPSGTIQATSIGSPGRFYASGITLDDLAEQLRYRGGLDHPVINMTHLEGRYTIDLHWPPDDSSGQTVSIADPAFIKAVKEQLGLRLEKESMPANILVVDFANKAPTPN